MKTLVFQSFRTENVPSWISTCMGTVRAWAALHGFEYRFVDDRLFQLVPEWFRRKTRHLCPVTELARLLAAREFLAQGYERAVWVDADIVVFAPERMIPDVGDGFALCHEVWALRANDGRIACIQRVNNSIAMFTAKSPHLDFLIDACERIGRSLPEIGKFAVGTVLLSRLNAVLPLPLLRNVGMFSPIVMADIADGTRHCLETYARQLPAPLACANLCLSNHDQHLAGVVLDDRCCERVLAKCLQSGGEVVNGLVQEWPAAQLRRSVG